jgi:hypothetical protein
MAIDVDAALTAIPPYKQPVSRTVQQIVDPLQNLKGLPNISTHAKGVTGLDTQYPQLYDINVDLIPVLEKLDYSKYFEELMDCEDRAFWGMAHLRHECPGCLVGVVSGKAQYLPDDLFPNKDHAVIILWRKLGNELAPIFFDPLGALPNPVVQNPVNFNSADIYSIVSFPVGKPGVPDTVKPIVGGPARLPSNSALLYDKNRLIYAKDDLMDYLMNKPYEQNCPNKEFHKMGDEEFFNDNFLDYDRALFAMVHARRGFIGVPLGIALGNKIDGESTCVVIFWHQEGADLKPSYYDPITNKEVKFTPSMIFV